MNRRGFFKIFSIGTAAAVTGKLALPADRSNIIAFIDPALPGPDTSAVCIVCIDREGRMYAPEAVKRIRMEHGFPTKHTGSIKHALTGYRHG